jgi:hypothetical protein
MIYAHVGGIPLEETLAMGGPAMLTALGAAVTRLHARRLRKRRPELGLSPGKMGDLPDVRLSGRAYGRGTANSQSQEESCSL